MMQDWQRIGEILVGRFGVPPGRLNEALEAQGRTLRPLISTAVELGIITPQDGARALGEQFGVPAVHLEGSVLDLDPLGLVPAEVATSHRVLPLGLFGGRLRLAMARPNDRPVLDELAFASGYGVLPFVSPRAMLDRAIRAAYRARQDGRKVWKGSEASSETPQLNVLTPLKKVKIESALPQDGLENFPQAPAPHPRKDNNQPRVLAVDDEPEILDIIDKALSHKGMEVLKAGRGRQALELLRSSQPDIVLLDAMLPEIHGFELCQQIKRSEQYKNTPVMIISAIYTGWNFIQDVKRVHGADDYMTKPFRVMELVHRVQDLLQRSGNRQHDQAHAETQRRVEASLREAMDRMTAGQTTEALEAAEAAVRQDPFDARAHFVYGTALHRLGRVYEAISEYERVVELAPNQFNALKNLAVLYERQGFKAKAVEMWTRALERSPSDPVRKTIKAHLIDLL
ncbi:MAG: response regulator [Myxococcota bacterium]